MVAEKKTSSSYNHFPKFSPTTCRVVHFPQSRRPHQTSSMPLARALSSLLMRSSSRQRLVWELRKSKLLSPAPAFYPHQSSLLYVKREMLVKMHITPSAAVTLFMILYSPPPPPCDASAQETIELICVNHCYLGSTRAVRDDNLLSSANSGVVIASSVSLCDGHGAFGSVLRKSLTGRLSLLYIGPRL